MEILKYAIIIICAIGFFSCGGGDAKKVDETKPTITLNSPTTNAMITAGSVLNVSALVSDDVKLEDYVLTITYTGTKSVKNVEEFYFSSNTDLDASGNALPLLKGEKSVDLNFDIAVSDNAIIGDYLFSLTVNDQSGNTIEEMVQFEISQP